MKRYPFFKLLTVFLLVLTVTSCRKNYPLPEKHAILFQYEYVNNAMGHRHNGFYIDNEGNVLTYNDPEEWHFPDETLSINYDHVAENLAQCTHSGIKVQDEILEKYSGHIPGIVLSKVTAEKNTGADMGRIQYLCYQYDEHSHCYKGAVIKMEGDFTKENLNFYSRKIVTWLKSIADSLSK